MKDEIFNYMLEYVNGSYASFKLISDVDLFRSKRSVHGVLYTMDGHLVNEEISRRDELKSRV